MRTQVFDAANQSDPEEQLSTGEAAKLLNSSRQHVVDLCAQGLLSFTTIGTHRRVRRADVEALRTRTERLTVDQQKSLWLAYAIAGRIVRDPSAALSLAAANIEKMKTRARGSSKKWLEEWRKLIAGPLDVLLASLTARDLRGRELRQHLPFAGLLSDEERSQVLDAWRMVRSPANHSDDS